MHKNLSFVALVLFLLWWLSRRSAAVAVGLTLTQPDFEGMTVTDDSGQGPRWSAWPQANGTRN